MMLDCFDADSAFTSTSEIFGVSRSTLHAVLNEMVTNEDVNWFDSTRHFLGAVSKRLGTTFSPAGSYYFHFTRVFPGTDFHEGLLPTTQVVDRLWDTVESLLPTNIDTAVVRDARKTILLSRHSDAFHYRLRMEFGMSGPFGQLVRSTIFNPTAQGLHFLRAPEVLEHICWFLKPQIGVDLSEKYSAMTKPCLVKFRTHEMSNEALGDALLYLYGLQKGELPHLGMCYDGGGKPVPPEDIVKVEWIEDSFGDV